MPQPPQLAGSVLVSTHVPPQSVCPDGHAHDPPWQVVPPEQILPQEPQLLLSELRSTHPAGGHLVSPVEQPRSLSDCCDACVVGVCGEACSGSAPPLPVGSCGESCSSPGPPLPNGACGESCSSPGPPLPDGACGESCSSPGPPLPEGSCGIFWAQAIPGIAASRPPASALPAHLSASPLERLRLASPLASSSKECSAAGSPLGGGRTSSGRFWFMSSSIDRSFLFRQSPGSRWVASLGSTLAG